MRPTPVLALLVTLATSMFGQSIQKNPAEYEYGNWWFTQSDSAKIAYVHGFRRGMDLGVGLALGKVSQQSGDSLSSVVTFRYQSSKSQFFRYVSNQQFVRSLDSLYAFSQYQGIPTTHMMWVAANLVERFSRVQGELMLNEYQKMYKP